MTFNISAKKKHSSHIGDIMGKDFYKVHMHSPRRGYHIRISETLRE